MKNHGCYIYTRVSTAMQVDGFSLDAQKEKLRKYAEFQNYYIFGEYSDEGKSGKNISGRPEFQRMMEDIATGKDNVEYVLVFKLSRFGRNAADVLSCLQEMQDYGVNLICVEDGIDSSKDSGKLMISVLSAVAEIERENILVQTMEGRKQKAREGKWNGGFAPYGYKLVDGKLEIAEEEAEVIKLIYDKFVHTNMGAATIARYLNDHEYKKIQRQNGTLDTFSAHFIKIVLDNPVYCGKLAYGRRKNEKINGTRNQYHTVKQDDFPIYDGIHEAIVSEEVWTQAQAKRRQTGVKNEKIYSLEHQHLLSGIVCCPECGKPMYGSVNRKKKKDGSFYSDYWYYACKHRLGYDGHKCNYTHQIHQEELNGAVEEIVKQMVKNPAFEAAIQEKLNASMDTGELEKEKELLRKRLRQMTAAKDKVADQMDTLDIADENYEMRYDDLQARQDNIYNEIGATRKELQELEIRIHNIREQKITSERVYEFLQMYDIVYDKFSDAEKKEFMNSFIEKVEVYPERQPDGRILKSIQFRFPVYFHEDKIDMFFPDDKKTVETVVMMSRIKK